MAKRHLRKLGFGFALAAAAISAHARADVQFTDGTFNETDWTSSKIVDSTSGTAGSFTITRVASGGNPGPFRRVTHTFHFDYMDEGTLAIAHLRAGATYDPSTQGAISSIAYSYDLRKPRQDDSDYTRYSPLLFQNGAYYKTTDENASGVIFTRVAREGIQASRFTRFAGSGPLRPDFSASGAPIQVGYVTSNSSSGGFGEGGGEEDSLQSDIDNWTITFATAGAPEGVSCHFSPPNQFLSFHRPEWHVLLDPNQNPDHVLVVEVTSDGAPARDVDVALTASKPVFSSSASQPASSTATAKTDSDGQASVIVNPPAPAAFDQITLEAGGSVGNQSFSCSGSVVTGMGTLSALIGTSIGQALGVRAAAAPPAPFDRAAARGASARERFAPKPSLAVENTIARLQRNLGPAGIQAPAAPAPTTRGDTVAAARARVEHRYGNLPLRFERNRGQVDGEIRYLARSRGYQVGLLPGEILLMNNSPAGKRADSSLRIRFAGANASPRIDGREELLGKSHYFAGPDPRQWRTGIEQYAKVSYRDVYPGIDLVFHGRERQLEFDFVVAPRARTETIELAFQGIERLELNDAGDLTLHHGRAPLRMHKPVVYQLVNGSRKEIAARYVLKEGNRAGFEVAAYDLSVPLIIDPVVSYAGYLGASGADAGTSIAVDSEGNTYLAGLTASPDFPTAGALQADFISPTDVFVTKLDPTGSNVIYSTYIGGSGFDAALGIAVDAEGSAYVTGATGSNDFPTANAVQSAGGGDAPPLGADAFLFKLNPAGSALVYSTYLGGTRPDAAMGIAVDAAGNAHVAGITTSTDFPTADAFQPANRGAAPLTISAFVAKLNAAGSSLVYSTYLGGAGPDLAAAIALDGAGNAYVSGTAGSADFPTLNPFQAANAGASDAFATKLNASGALVYSTYLGGQSDDQGTGIAVSAEGIAYVTGTTGSADFPLLGAAQPALGAADEIGFDAFVTKLAANGSSLVYSTYLGGGGTDVARAVAVAADGRAYVAGETDSEDFPTASAIQPIPSGLTEGFVARLNASGAAFEYSTTVGGAGHDSAAGIALHSGGVYLAGTSLSSDLPVTYGAFQGVFQGLADASILKIVEGTPEPKVSTLSAASFQIGGAVAAESIVSGFGEGLASGIETAQTLPLPTTLLGTTVLVKDSAGNEQPSPLFFVSPGQINYAVPGGLASGLAAVRVENSGQAVASGTLVIDAVAPGLFAANADGKGVAAAVAVRALADGSQSSQIIFTCGPEPGSCVPAPVVLGGETEQVYLLLFGTGIRRRGSLTEVDVTVGGVSVPVLFAGAHPELAGLDQINAGPLPRSLAGRGQVNIVLTVDEKTANTVTMAVQ
jgi:uncharacterized protein (TIGR03437 family)